MATKHSVDDQYDNACQCARTRAISAMGRSAQGLLVPIAAAATAVTVAAVATVVSGERTREGPVFHPHAATGQEGADFYQSHGAHVSRGSRLQTKREPTSTRMRPQIKRQRTTERSSD